MAESKTADQAALEYGIKWFEFHAQQRTTTFNFYLIIYSSLAIAVAFLLKAKLQELLLIIETNSVQPVQIRTLVKEIISLNAFRNNLVHGAWGMYDLTGQFWEKTWVDGNAFKTKTFRVNRDEVVVAINRIREAREALTRLSDAVVREFLADLEHVPWPEKLRRQGPKRRKTSGTST